MPVTILQNHGSRWFACLLVASLAAAPMALCSRAAPPPRPGPGGALFPTAGGEPTTTVEVGKTTVRPSGEPPVKADAYEQLKVDESKDKYREVYRMLRDGLSAGDQQVFDDYYNLCVFPPLDGARQHGLSAGVSLAVVP